MSVFGWLLRGNIPDERRNSEGKRRGTYGQHKGKGVLGVSHWPIEKKRVGEMAKINGGLRIGE
jgi:hypothetical protein